MLPLVHELNVSPWRALQALADLPYPIFFDSALPQSALSRYSYVSADPVAFLRCDAGEGGGALEALRARLGAPRPTLAGLPPFQGGFAGLFGYDLCHELERLPRHRINEFQTPDLAVGLYDWVYAFDHLQDRGWVISTGAPTFTTDRATTRLQTAIASLNRTPVSPKVRRSSSTEVAPQHRTELGSSITSNFTRPDFERVIQRGIDYVRGGDCFQVNLAQRLLTPQTEHPLELYRRLRERNAAPFGGYFDLGDFAIASASPERFLQLDATGLVETRPIKGTRPRGATPAEDQRLANELLHSAKDRAENIMIVDLLRNDLGRVCQYGSVKVPSLCALESYRTVHHLVSAVEGRLRPGLDAIDLLRATFPGGSVTGAPKVRALEIIAELEPTARGPYCGTLGWIGFDGAMDTSILIRTFTIGKGWVQFPVGGGIVADSDPKQEYEETLHKAAGLVKALTA
jgi:para-aminobenzoate synthetase component 1